MYQFKSTTPGSVPGSSEDGGNGSRTCPDRHPLTAHPRISRTRHSAPFVLPFILLFPIKRLLSIPICLTGSSLSPGKTAKSRCHHYTMVAAVLSAGLWKIYSFTPPAERLPMMYFEQNANTIRIGMTEIATAR